MMTGKKGKFTPEEKQAKKVEALKQKKDLEEFMQR